MTREIEENRIASSEMVEHLCFKSVKQSFFIFFRVHNRQIPADI